MKPHPESAQTDPYWNGHLESCAGMDTENDRCGCGFLQVLAYRKSSTFRDQLAATQRKLMDAKTGNDFLAAANAAMRDDNARLLAENAALQATLNAIKTALRDRHFAFDIRQHGGVADGTFANVCEGILDMPWKQGAEKAARAAIRAAEQGEKGAA